MGAGPSRPVPSPALSGIEGGVEGRALSGVEWRALSGVEGGVEGRALSGVEGPDGDGSTPLTANAPAPKRNIG